MRRSNVLAICGSLRAASINRTFCRAAARLAPRTTHITLFDGLGCLPLFNPDLELVPPQAVVALRESVAAADALLIASPEYAHGISGVMKNLLDWLVSFEGFVGKPVAVVNTSPRAHHAQGALCETLRTMSARIIDEASIAVPLLGSGLGEHEIADSPVLARVIRDALEALAWACTNDAQRTSTDRVLDHAIE